MCNNGAAAAVRGRAPLLHVARPMASIRIAEALAADRPLVARIVGVSENADRALEAWAGRFAGTVAGDITADDARHQKPAGHGLSRVWRNDRGDPFRERDDGVALVATVRVALGERGRHVHEEHGRDRDRRQRVIASADGRCEC